MTNKPIHCVGCEGGIEALPEIEVKSRVAKLTDWTYDESKKRLSKTFKFKGFLKTMSFVNAVAWVANAEMHHPDLEVTYNTCTINFQTHSVNGVTENDFICVDKVESLMV